MIVQWQKIENHFFFNIAGFIIFHPYEYKLVVVNLNVSMYNAFFPTIFHGLRFLIVFITTQNRYLKCVFRSELHQISYENQEKIKYFRL